MRNVQANVNPFSQQTTTTTTDNINRQQQWTKRSLCVFPAKADDTKTVEMKQAELLREAFSGDSEEQPPEGGCRSSSVSISSTNIIDIEHIYYSVHFKHKYQKKN